MARRHGAMRVPRKNRDWSAVQNVAVPATSILGNSTITSFELFSPEEGEIEATVGRIVGSFGIVPVAGNELGTMAWGIAVVPTVGGTPISPDPLLSVDGTNRLWLHQRQYWTIADLNSYGGLNPRYSVDIKVMRKVRAGEQLRLIISSGVGPASGWNYGFYLRMLLLK